MTKQNKKWLIRGALGCILIGTGFSFAVEASHWKHQGESLLSWAGIGTVGLTMLIIGIMTLITNRPT